MWHPIEIAPFDKALELAVQDREGTHALVFPCRRGVHGWVDARNGDLVPVRPTHWRPWRHGGPER